MSLEIGGYVFPTASLLNVKQEYEPIGGSSIFRSINGKSQKQTTWKKKAVITSGDGWMPSGIENIDFDQQLVLKCIVPLSLPGDGSIALPAGKYRTDGKYVPFGLARKGASVIKTDLVGNACAVVEGASDYTVCYFPKLTVWCDRPLTSGDPNSASFTWQIRCEEV